MNIPNITTNLNFNNKNKIVLSLSNFLCLGLDGNVAFKNIANISNNNGYTNLSKTYFQPFKTDCIFDKFQSKTDIKSEYKNLFKQGFLSLLNKNRFDKSDLDKDVYGLITEKYCYGYFKIFANRYPKANFIKSYDDIKDIAICDVISVLLDTW